MVGTINLSLTQQLDEFGQPLSGGQLYFIQAGTTSTPQNAYQDTALTIPWPNPITLDAAGRVPMFYLADGQIKVRLQDAMGVVKFVADNLLVIGPSSGGGGGGSVDPTTVLQTGDVKWRYGTGTLAGFVRMNGNTIGNSSSPATELADPSAQALFLYLWGADSALAVTPGGRGASASADWGANKAIALPDGRSRLIGMLDGMGSTVGNNGYWTNANFSKGNATTLGALAGILNTNVTLGTPNLPPYTPSGSVGTSTSVSISGGTVAYTAANAAAAGGVNMPGGNTLSNISASASSSSTFTGSAQGGTSTPFNVAPPIMLMTGYMKL